MAAVLVLVTSFVACGGTAAADTVSAVQQIQVTAKVLPMRRIFIDRSGTITQITSNTASDVTPEVFVGTDLPNNRVQLTSDILAQYKRLVPAGTGKPGILYSRPTSASAFAGVMSLMTARPR